MVLPNCSFSQFHAISQMAEEILGATGEESTREMRVKPKADQEHRLLTRLAKNNLWIIPESIYESGPKVMADIVDSSVADSRERIQAARTLVMMANANTGQQSVEVRINQAIAIEIAPEAPADADLDIRPGYAEVVNTDSMNATVDVLIQLGHMPRYVDQVKNTAPPLPSNGNGGLN